MPTRIAPGDPAWTFDPGDIERQIAQFAKTNGIAGQAAWTAFIASISTLAQALAVCRGLLSSVKCDLP